MFRKSSSSLHENQVATVCLNPHVPASVRDLGTVIRPGPSYVYVSKGFFMCTVSPARDGARGCYSLERKPVPRFAPSLFVFLCVHPHPPPSTASCTHLISSLLPTTARLTHPTHYTPHRSHNSTSYSRPTRSFDSLHRFRIYLTSHSHTQPAQRNTSLASHMSTS